MAFMPIFKNWSGIFYKNAAAVYQSNNFPQFVYRVSLVFSTIGDWGTLGLSAILHNFFSHQSIRRKT